MDHVWLDWNNSNILPLLHFNYGNIPGIRKIEVQFNQI